MAARLGGDEFALLVEQTNGSRDVAIIAERVLAALRSPIWLSGREVVISASIGIARGGSSVMDADLTRAADAALYRAKAAGPGVYAAATDAGMHPLASAVLPGMSDWLTDAALAGD